MGVNLLPTTKKICNFNCIYCECGLTDEPQQFSSFPSRKEVYDELENKLLSMKKDGQQPDVITFAGNGEPTLHPEFPEIIGDVIKLRNNIFPLAKIAVLSNATTIANPKIKDALLMVDQNILKLDSALDKTIERHNKPNRKISAAELINDLKAFNGKLIIQTLFTRGVSGGKKVDNTSYKELDEWIDAIEVINPSEVMIYTISRDAPEGSHLEKIPLDELNAIAEMINDLGIKTQVSG